MACVDSESGELQTVCRVMSGFTDTFYKEKTEFYKVDELASLLMSSLSFSVKTLLDPTGIRLLLLLFASVLPLPTRLDSSTVPLSRSRRARAPAFGSTRARCGRSEEQT